MSYTITVTRNAKVNGYHYNAGETVKNIDESLFDELENRKLVATFKKDENDSGGELPEYEKITGSQIKERLTFLDVDHEGISDKKELYAMLEKTLAGVGE